MHRGREEEPDHAQRDAGEAQRGRRPDQGRDRGNDRRGGEHDRDLHRRRGHFVVMVGRHRVVALLLGLLRPRGELLAAFLRLRLVLVALRRFLPFGRLLLPGFSRTAGFDFFGGRPEHGLAEGLRLEGGPQVWEIKINKRPEGEAEETLGEIAAKDLRKAEVFNKYGLDFCCGGKKTLKEACEEKGLDVTKIEQELQNSDKSSFTARPLPYNDWNLDFLADYIVNTHHSYVKKTIPDIRTYADKVAKVHGSRHPELLEINKLAQEVCDEMSEHMIKEENVLFPYVKHIVSTKNQAHEKFDSLDTVKEPIDIAVTEHELVGGNMDKIRNLSHNYQVPEDACASYSYLFKTLDEFENDLHIHVHLENNILFPKAIALEKN